MYTYVKAVVLGRSIGSQWVIVDISNTVVYSIFQTYRQVFLELANPALDHTVYIDFYQLYSEYFGYNDTLNHLLTAIGIRALTTVDHLPNQSIRYAKYSDAFYAGYKVNLTKIGMSLPSNYPSSDLPDLIITRPNYTTDVGLLQSHCLITVNGLLHQTTTDGTYCYVKDGGRTLHKSNHNQLGILSFLDIGAITQIPITDTNVYSDPNGLLKDRLYIHSPIDTTSRVVALSLGGYLILPEANTFWRVSDNTFAVSLNNMPFLERYFESNLYIDLSSLGLDLSLYNPDLISVPQYLSDVTIRKYLALSQSFLIMIDTDNLTFNKIYIRSSNMPGMFTSYQDPAYPLVVNYGKLAEYWKTYEGRQWSVHVQDSYLRNYVFTDRPVYQQPTVTPQAIPGRTFYHSRGYLLEIGSQKQA